MNNKRMPILVVLVLLITVLSACTQTENNIEKTEPRSEQTTLEVTESAETVTTTQSTTEMTTEQNTGDETTSKKTATTEKKVTTTKKVSNSKASDNSSHSSSNANPQTTTEHDHSNDIGNCGMWFSSEEELYEYWKKWALKKGGAGYYNGWNCSCGMWTADFIDY